uniref:Integrin beta n=1 Tax=Sphenodon punctatus TaxID=8508 RepID=A0A8D0HRM5_SPHPU
MARCATRQELEHRGCTPDEILEPHGRHTVVENRPLSDSAQSQTVTQLAPQRVILHLRPGEEQSFEVQFKRAEGYPVDLYYLMDLSYSMKDDLENIKRLGSDLLATLRKITSSVKIGFGSFVDKTVLPYVNMLPAKRHSPCPNRLEPCQPAFSFRHVLPLTDNASEFESRVSQQRISGNLDAPEGGFDAIMQVAVCIDQIGWRNVTRLLVFTSDDTFHMAGDGKLGGIYTPNDGHCHLDASGLYDQSHLYDYPSVGHLAQVLLESNIQSIFAVTGSTLSVYQELSRLIPKSAVGELKEDSSNVVQLIADAYNNLSSTVNLEHMALPPDVFITYDSHCGGVDTYGRTQGGICSGVRINQLVRFTVHVVAKPCLPGPQELVLRVLGMSEEVRVQLVPLCECQCEDTQPQAPYCSSGHGNLSCGACSCQAGWVGRLCECQQAEAGELETGCRDGNDTGPVCNGKGRCVCGQCQCHPGMSGHFCKCDDTSCDWHDGKLCAGRGQCQCGRCQCPQNYTGAACDCSLDVSGCMQGGIECSGHGHCDCNKCECDAGWFGSLCSSCIDCPTPCGEHRDCAECRAFGTGVLGTNCSTSCNQTVEVVESPALDERWCKEQAGDGGLLIYRIETDSSGRVTLTVKAREAGADLTSKLVLGLVLGIVFLGLLLIGTYRATVEIYDRREFARFEKERQQVQWNEVNNPLFQSATTTVVNPQYNCD